MPEFINRGQIMKNENDKLVGQGGNYDDIQLSIYFVRDGIAQYE